MTYSHGINYLSIEITCFVKNKHFPLIHLLCDTLYNGPMKIALSHYNE